MKTVLFYISNRYTITWGACVIIENKRNNKKNILCERIMFNNLERILKEGNKLIHISKCRILKKIKI